MQRKCERHYKVFQLLQSVVDCHCKVCQALKSVSSIAKCDRLLLQSVSGITKSGSYCKVTHNKIGIFTFKTFVKIPLVYGDIAYDGSRLSKKNGINTM